MSYLGRLSAVNPWGVPIGGESVAPAPPQLTGQTFYAQGSCPPGSVEINRMGAVGASTKPTVQCMIQAAPARPAHVPLPPPPAPAPVITVSPAIQTTVTPQISPVFQQAFQPSGSPMTAATAQTSPAVQTAETAPPPPPAMSPAQTAETAPLPPSTAAPAYAPPPPSYAPPGPVPMAYPPMETAAPASGGLVLPQLGIPSEAPPGPAMIVPTGGEEPSPTPPAKAPFPWWLVAAGGIGLLLVMNQRKGKRRAT